MPHVKAALIACVVAIIATATATFCYVAFDLGLYDVGWILYAPLLQACVVAIPAGIVLGIARRRTGRVTFPLLVLIVVATLAMAFGELVIGESPHFSRNRAIIFLVASWVVFA